MKEKKGSINLSISGRGNIVVKTETRNLDDLRFDLHNPRFNHKPSIRPVTNYLIAPRQNRTATLL